LLSDTFPWIQPLYDGCQENRQHWQELASQVEMGLTWIDHDTIDKPVEEFLGKIQLFKPLGDFLNANCKYVKKTNKIHNFFFFITIIYFIYIIYMFQSNKFIHHQDVTAVLTA
jgi:hypothetical protein